MISRHHIVSGSKLCFCIVAFLAVLWLVLAGVIPNLYEAETNGTKSGGIIGGDASTSGGQYIQFTNGGDYWNFSNNMSSIAALVTRSTYGTTFDVYIDDNYSGTFNTYDSIGTNYQRPIRIFNFLNGRNHSIQLKHTGVLNPAGQKNFDLDAFFVNTTNVTDQREFEDNWAIQNGNRGADGNASGSAIFQLPNRTAYWTGWGSGKYIIIYTTHTPSGSYFNASYNGLKESFNTYVNGYLYLQKHLFYVNTFDNNYLLTINNSGINNTLNSSVIDLDKIVFYPYDRPTNSSLTIVNQTNSTKINLTWTGSTSASGNSITYNIYVQQYDNGTAFNVSSTSATSVVLDMSGKNHNHYYIYIEPTDGYLESTPNITSGFYYFDNKTANQRAIAAADFLLLNQNADGAVPDSPSSDFYNSDNNMGYAMMAWYYAWKNTTNASYIDAMGSALDFIATKQDSNGTWQYSYKRNAGTGTYYPDVWDVYKASNITNISTVDAVQSYFAYDLWLYSMSNRNSTKVSNLTSIAERGVQRHITENYDGSRFFFSSWQYKNTTNAWSKYEVKYSAGQIDTILGLMAIWNLTGNETYLTYAKTIKQDFDSYYWNTTPKIYSQSLDVNNLRQSPYLFAQGYILSVLPSLPNATNSYNYIKNAEQIDGSVNTTDAPNGETINAAVTLLASLTLNRGNTTNLTNYLAKKQTDSANLTNNGGFEVDKTTGTLSIPGVGFAVPALLSTTLEIPNYIPKFAINLTAQSATANSAFSYLCNCSDLDGDTVTYSTNSSVVSINSSTGLVTDTPAASEVGSHEVAVTCSDGKGNRTQSFTYSVAAVAAATAVGSGASYERYPLEKLESKQEFALELDDEITLLMKGELHTIKLAYIGSGYAKFDIYSKLLQLTVYKDERKTVDLDKDGTADIALVLSKIRPDSVEILIEPLNNKAPVEILKPGYKCAADSECSAGNVCFNHMCVRLFDIKIWTFESPAKTGDFLEFSYLLEGRANISGNVVVDFWIENEEGIVTSGSDTIYLGYFEDRNESTRILLPIDINPGVYELIITAKYGNYVAKSHKTIEIEVAEGMATITPVSEYYLVRIARQISARKYLMFARYKGPVVITYLVLGGIVAVIAIIHICRRQGCITRILSKAFNLTRGRLHKAKPHKRRFK